MSRESGNHVMYHVPFNILKTCCHLSKLHFGFMSNIRFFKFDNWLKGLEFVMRLIPKIDLPSQSIAVKSGHPKGQDIHSRYSSL